MTQYKLRARCSEVPPLRRRAIPRAARLVAGLLASSLVIGTTALGTSADERDTSADERGRGGFCSRTAKAALLACGNEVQDDFWIAKGICINLSDDAERKRCNADAQAARRDGPDLCQEQYRARLDVCGLVGEDRYDPEFDPAQFVDPDEIGVSVAPNPYFPLIRGTRWVYNGPDETFTDTVTDKTKLIDGVTCRVVHDEIEKDGVIVEITDDWFAQDLAGNVWYCGEIVQELETFEGDDPAEPELLGITGSWKAGREGGKPGIFVLVAPQVGDAYRAEVSLGQAEDVAEVISITGTEGVPAAQCNNDCLVTREFTPLEPGVEEFFYYAPGVGLILEVDGEGNRFRTRRSDALVIGTSMGVALPRLSSRILRHPIGRDDMLDAADPEHRELPLSTARAGIPRVLACQIANAMRAGVLIVALQEF